MFSKLLYSHTLYVPLNIRYSELFGECEQLDITYDKTIISRVYIFYGSVDNLRRIKTKYILKEYHVEI